MNREKYVATALTLLLIGGGAYFFKFRKTDSKERFREVTIEKGNLDVSILATGTVQPENRVEIKAPIDGRAEDVLVKEGSLVKKGDVLAWMSSSERAALLDAARAKGPKEYKTWEGLYKPTPIMAPINGTIIQRNIESGQGFAKTDAIFVMSDRLTVKAQVDETDIAQIKVEQPARIVLDAYSDKPLDGKVDLIAYDAKTVSNVTTYDVDVLPAETPPFMRSGMTANVSFEITSKEDVLLVPSDAVKYADGQPKVRLKGSEEDKAIQIGASDGKMIEVTEGLSAGDVVLVPEYKLGQSENKANPFAPTRRRGGRGH